MGSSLETAAPAAVAQGLRRIAIDPLSRVEGHGKVTILIDAQNRVQQVRLHIVEFRAHCKTLVAVGACAINGGLPAQRNRMDLGVILRDVYASRPGLRAGSAIPDDPELPLPLNQVHPIHEVVHVDYFLPGCPPSADAFWSFLTDLMAGRTPRLGHGLIHYD